MCSRTSQLLAETCWGSRVSAHPPALSHRERQLPSSVHKGAGCNARLMLDALIETVSYEPLAIFMIVAIVLLIMLARTL